MSWQDELDQINLDPRSELNQPRPAAEWRDALNALRSLVSDGMSSEQRTALAGRFDTFVKNSWAVDDPDSIIRFDAAARKYAQALRLQNTQERVNALAAAASEISAAGKQFEAISAQLKKQAAELRAEKLLDAINAVNGTLNSLQALAKIVKDDVADDVKNAIQQTFDSAKRLRAVLEGMNQ